MPDVIGPGNRAGALRLVGARVDATPRVLHAGNAPKVRGGVATAFESPRSAGGRSQERGGPKATATPPRVMPLSVLAPSRQKRVAKENASAAGLSEDDARLLLARHTAAILESDAGRLRPERRRRLHDLATRLGLRAFDANLVIAVVQDAAANEGAALTQASRSRLALVGAVRSKPASGDAGDGLLVLGTGVVLGLIGAALLIASI